VAAVWSPEKDPELERRASPPPPGWDVFGTPADAPAPPAATVSVLNQHLVIDGSEPWSFKTSEAARRTWAALRPHRAALWVLIECLTVAVAGILSMRLLDAFGPAPWVALGGALYVVVQTRSQLDSTGSTDVFSVLRSLTLAFAASAALSVLDLSSQAELAAAGWVLVVAAVVIVCTLLLRHSTRRPARVVVVGDRAAIGRAAMRWADGSVHVIGGVLAGEEGRLQSIVGVPTVTGLEHAADWARGRRADLVVVVPGHGLTGPQARALAWSLEGSGIRMAVDDLVADAAPHRVQARRLGPATIIEVAPTRPGALTRVAKNCIDRAVGAALLALATPALSVLALVVRIDSRGPALFKQVRVGRDGRPFTMYKLRTMEADAERRLVTLRDQNEGAGLLFKMQDDPRVTRFGKLLRRTSLDELPQLINVVKGEMSLVGPRPGLPCEVAEYDDVELRRLAVKPGMTGLWQVSGRSSLDWETSIALDLHYVDNWRLADDLVIGLRTVGAVVGARGAF
jgi:exopolysaccharide biosynthesis polyprenyl glycosylphosphotransferase